MCLNKTPKTMKNWWLSLFFCGALLAQKNPNPLYFPLSPEGKTFIKAGLRTQFWARYTQANPQTTINGESYENFTDFSIRRIRLNLQAQITPKLYFFSLFGGNNYNAKTEKSFRPQILDFYIEYEFHKSLTLGAGKMGWDGPSRWTIFANGTMLGTDALVFALFTLNKQDDNGRSIGLFAKGELGALSYHIAVKDPTFINIGEVKNSTDFTSKGLPRKRWSGYLKYDFWQKESSKNPYSGGTGTYLGKKKILNIGAGFSYQPDMMWALENTKPRYYDYKSWAVEVFLDRPISQRNDAITAYAGYFHSDFGPRYLRFIGPNSIVDAAQQGNAYPMIGTGRTLFLQLGYLLPRFQKTNLRWQPHFSAQYSQWEALTQPVWFFDSGINIYFRGQDSKLSIGIQNRPVLTTDLNIQQRKNTIILQYQFQL